MATAAVSALGYAGFGFLARCYALDFSGHLLFAGTFGALGYWLHGVKISQQEILEKKQNEMRERRTA